jgi:hypothetical protein
MENVNIEQIIEFGLSCLRCEQTQRPYINDCDTCTHFIVDNKQRKYKYGCERLCEKAIKTLVDCGFTNYGLLASLAGKYEEKTV